MGKTNPFLESNTNANILESNECESMGLVCFFPFNFSSSSSTLKKKSVCCCRYCCPCRSTWVFANQKRNYWLSQNTHQIIEKIYITPNWTEWSRAKLRVDETKMDKIQMEWNKATLYALSVQTYYVISYGHPFRSHVCALSVKTIDIKTMVIMMHIAHCTLSIVHRMWKWKKWNVEIQ